MSYEEILKKYPQLKEREQEEIKKGYDHGLSEDKIEFFANPKFDSWQMAQIRLGFQNGLTFDEIKLYIDFKDPNQMSQIRAGFETGLTFEQVKSYAKPELTWLQMEVIRMALQRKLNLTDEQFQLCSNSHFTSEELNQILSGFEKGLSVDKVAIYAKPCYDRGQMNEIRLGLENNLSNEQVEVYANPRYDFNKMKLLRCGFVHGFTQEQVEIYAHPEFSIETMNLIFNNLRARTLADDLIKVYAKSDYNCEQMVEIRKGLESNLSRKQIELYANPEFDALQMSIIRQSFKFLNDEQIKTYANPKLTVDQMQLVCYAYKCNLPEKQIEQILNKFEREVPHTIADDILDNDNNSEYPNHIKHTEDVNRDQNGNKLEGNER